MQTYLAIDEILELYEQPLEKLVEISSEITEKNFNNKMDFCSLISAKTGKCGENCKYCAQSSHYRTEIETHPLVTVEEVKNAALNARDNGVTRFAIVTSGRTPDKEDFPTMLKMIEAIQSIDGLTSCASIGILNEQEVRQLRDAGLIRYHHNINTCRSYYPDVCTTHTYEDRINTVNLVQQYGMELCCGVILGMGETRRQRAEMALELKEINPDSVPLNFLYPIQGTPFENYMDKIDEKEILKTIAVLRIVLPETSLRYAGGRVIRLSQQNQELGIKAGVNSILVGNMLTTIGVNPEEDLEMIKRVGKTLAK